MKEEVDQNNTHNIVVIILRKKDYFENLILWPLMEKIIANCWYAFYAWNVSRVVT